MFTRSPQGRWIPPLNEDTAREFKKNCEDNNLTEWVVHTPYFINFASGNNRIRHGSIKVVREELERASVLGAKYLMTHLGSYKDLGHDVGLEKLVAGLKEMLTGYKGETHFLVEIAAGSGEIIGDQFEEIAEIIHHKDLKKFNVGVCFDTQHAFASGYDLRSAEALNETLKKFDDIIGLDNLKMFHCNDSKVALGLKKDRHEHIGEGEIGIKGFWAMINSDKLKNINFYLETEHDRVEEDLELLKKLRG